MRAEVAPASIREMFGRISAKYDFANTVLSFGIHHRWRNRLVKQLCLQPGHKILDCATGTGDLAFAIYRRLGGQCEVVGADFCEAMLEIARAKASKSGEAVRFALADAMQLPFPDQYFDFSTIAFGIRNVSEPAVGLRELLRVTKPGGSVMVLEFGQPRSKIWDKLFGFYSAQVLPEIGGMITGDAKAYQYLHRSSRHFPCGEKFAALVHSVAPGATVAVQALSGGIAYLYEIRRSHA